MIRIGLAKPNEAVVRGALQGVALNLSCVHDEALYKCTFTFTLPLRYCLQSVIFKSEPTLSGIYSATDWSDRDSQLGRYLVFIVSRVIFTTHFHSAALRAGEGYTGLTKASIRPHVSRIFSSVNSQHL